MLAMLIGHYQVKPGSSYQITYRCRTYASPYDLNERGCKITGAVDGTLVLVDYSWKMPRYDLITIDSKGTIRRIKGIAHPWQPSIPQAPVGQLALSYVQQKWHEKESPKVINNATYAIPMNDLEAMKKSINDLYALVAEERLRSDASLREPTAKKGVFVDPFFDDDMRDLGITQTAAIVNKELTLSITATVVNLEQAARPYLLPYELEPVLEQLLQTKEMKINPYQAFDPVPAKATINLSVDHWTEVKTNWLSSITSRFSVNNSTELISSRSNQVAFMRQATQSFELEGFVPHEELKELRLDSISIKPEA